MNPSALTWVFVVLGEIPASDSSVWNPAAAGHCHHVALSRGDCNQLTSWKEGIKPISSFSVIGRRNGSVELLTFSLNHSNFALKPT